MRVRRTLPAAFSFVLLTLAACNGSMQTSLNAPTSLLEGGSGSTMIHDEVPDEATVLASREDGEDEMTKAGLPDEGSTMDLVDRHAVVDPEFLKNGDKRWRTGRWAEHHEIDAFANRTSIAENGVFCLRVSTKSKSYRTSAYRFGPYRGASARLVWRSSWTPSRGRGSVSIAPRTRTVSATFPRGPCVRATGWPAGHYLLRADSSGGFQTWVPMTVRSPSTSGRVVLMSAVSTWQAYNGFGGYSAYAGPGGFDTRSTKVSFDRPYDLRGLSLFFSFERPLWARAQALGIRIAYTTDIDVSSGRTSLRGARALVVPGHAEYWSTQLRRAVVKARGRATNIFFAGANQMYWRVRYEATKLGHSRRLVIYKSLADPAYGHDNKNVTVLHRDRPHAYPESRLVGVLYVCYPAHGAYRVQSPGFWAFAGTGVRKGTTFPNLVGIEIDRAFLSNNTPRPMQVVAHSQARCHGQRRISDSTYYTTRSGAGVFAVGTMYWVSALKVEPGHGITPAGSHFARAVTDNVLRGFSRGPAGRDHPAKDNLARVYG